MKSDYRKVQELICEKYNASVCESYPSQKVGISLDVRGGALPINGMRLLPTEDTTGWYIWAGPTLSDEADYFKPIHVTHLDSWCPSIIPYLMLPPGWRVQIAPGYEDVWFDEGLLSV
jgi:hypothetical protein